MQRKSPCIQAAVLGVTLVIAVRSAMKSRHGFGYGTTSLLHCLQSKQCKGNLGQVMLQGNNDILMRSTRLEVNMEHGGCSQATCWPSISGLCAGIHESVTCQLMP